MRSPDKQKRRPPGTALRSFQPRSIVQRRPGRERAAVDDSTAGRVRYADAGRAMRAVITRTVEAGPTGRQWRVLAAVFSFTTAWSKLCDDVTLDQLGARAGFALPQSPPARRSRRRRCGTCAVTSAPSWSMGVITYTSGGGQGGASEIGVPDRAQGAPEARL